GWNFLWGKPMKFTDHMRLNEYQKVCHFPGTFFLGRKDSLSRQVNLFRRRTATGHEPDSQTQRFVLKVFRGTDETFYILKPKAGARGIGIRLLIDPEREVKRNASCIVQRYLDKPLLIDGRKFDLRLYVLVTCFDPLRIYLFDEGLVRMATEPYSHNPKPQNRHLTNYSINKFNPDFKGDGGEDEEGGGLKWSLAHFEEWMTEQGIEAGPVFARIKDLVIKTMLTVEAKINTNLQMHVPSRRNCYELFGFDVMLDANLKPWLIEVNSSPSLATDAPLDKKIKNQL
ncbi:tubulin-tyrosine ligase/Tubulin polyglutamylase, partial [Baffinella frigidus]